MSAFTVLFLKASGVVVGIGAGLAVCVAIALVYMGVVAGFLSVTWFLAARAEAMRRYAREGYMLEITWDAEQRQYTGRAFARPDDENPAETVIWPKPQSMTWKPRRPAP